MPSASSGNTKSFGIPNSATEQNMPSDTWPRNLPFLISVPSAKRDLWYATGTIWPTRTFVAAVTICFVVGSPSSVKHSTWQTCNLSASGCLVISTIFPV